MKLSGAGNIQWQKTYRTPEIKESYRQAVSIQQTSDEGYIVAGDTLYVSGTYMSYDDIFALRLDKNGDILWQKSFGGKQPDWANSIIQTKDDGFVLVAGTMSYGAGSCDIWCLKLKGDGSTVWQKTYGCTGYDNPLDTQSLGDAFCVLGSTESAITGTDLWLLKIDLHGTIIWDRVYGGKQDDAARSIWCTKDLGYILAGQTKSYGSGGSDTLVLKLDSLGKTCLPPRPMKSYSGGTESLKPLALKPSDSKASAHASELAPDKTEVKQYNIC